MLIGVVSDTHNNISNINEIIRIFNQEEVEYVIHTGDIASAMALEKFSSLKSKLIVVYGNNDRSEAGLKEIASKYSFDLQEPPYIVLLGGKKIAIFHEPEEIDNFLDNNESIDFIFHGHTHRYRNEIKSEAQIFNPGESAGFIKGKNAIGVIDLKNLSMRRIFF
tara:strand:- start:303 stop:794 length:492 start_codon:yes stop_codon:yes gene_type:complete